MGRRELTFQKYIVDSYRRQGGYAKKWASEWTSGNPDLICAMPGIPPHFIEVKHLPTWNGVRSIRNPMTEKQQIEAKKWRETGALVILGIITGPDARHAALHLCSPAHSVVHTDAPRATGKYILGAGFDMQKLVERYMEAYNERWF